MKFTMRDEWALVVTYLDEDGKPREYETTGSTQAKVEQAAAAFLRKGLLLKGTGGSDGQSPEEPVFTLYPPHRIVSFFSFQRWETTEDTP